jgi:hypothetical protein
MLPLYRRRESYGGHCPDCTIAVLEEKMYSKKKKKEVMPSILSAIRNRKGYCQHRRKTPWDIVREDWAY